MTLRINPFDQIILVTMAAVVVLIGLVIWRGDQIGFQATELFPIPDADHISVQTRIQIAFDQEIASGIENTLLRLEPNVEGTLRNFGDMLEFVPSTMLQPDTTYRVTLNPGLVSMQGRQLSETVTWQFHTGGWKILYSALDEEQWDQLYVIPSPMSMDEEIEAVEPYQLTYADLGMWDFSISPDGSSVIYTTLYEDNSSHIWQITADDEEPDILFSCPRATCSHPVWSPNGQFVAFTRQAYTLLASNVEQGAPRIWLYNVESGVAAQVFSDNQIISFSPTWSADSKWLSYISPDGGLGLYHLDKGTHHFFETRTGEPGAWHPNRNELLLNKMWQQGEQYVVHLFAVDAESGALVDLSGEEALVEDSSPTWSPDGEWIAFRRKEFDGPRASRGKQLWRMRADGSDGQPLTFDPDYDYAQPQWSPDGRFLLYHRLPLKGPDIVLSVWMLDVESGEQREIIAPGQRPIWWP